MDKKFQNKIRKLFETRLNLENELLKFHLLLLEYIENNNRTAKIDNAVHRCELAFEKAVDVNEQLIRLAGKMSLCHSQHPALQGARDLYNKLGLRHPQARTNQEIQNHEYLKTGLRSLISLRKVENVSHISLINLLPFVIHRLFTLCHQFEKRHQ